MDLVLQQLGQVPGVVGSLVCGADGSLAASAFPAGFDRGKLEQMAAQLAADIFLPEWMPGAPCWLDLRYRDGRVVVRPVEDSWLLVLCTPQVNIQLLQMSLVQATRRVQRWAPGAGPPPRPAPAASPPMLARGPARPPGELAELQEIARSGLGDRAAPALELLSRAGPSQADQLRAIGEVEEMTRLFVSRKEAEGIGRRLRAVVATRSPR
jgi:predicted regulator of Ras-like GTPase activity (Roadblock/LC7/MglB family)